MVTRDSHREFWAVGRAAMPQIANLLKVGSTPTLPSNMIQAHCADH